jgi:hypothetical protein
MDMQFKAAWSPKTHLYTSGLLYTIIFSLIAFLIVLSPAITAAEQSLPPQDNVEKVKSGGYLIQPAKTRKPSPIHAKSDEDTLSNPVQIENAKPGDLGWQVDKPVAKNGEIEGYASRTSVRLGRKISLFVSTLDPTYELTIYRIGWYNGAGGRKMLDTITLSGVDQRARVTKDPETGLLEADWEKGYRFRVPRNWTSGVYIAKLVSDGSITGDRYMSYINFVVRDRKSRADYLFQTSDTTYQAYNNWGGKSLYSFNSTDEQPAYKVSFNRPYKNGWNDAGAGQFFDWEVNMLRFLEREGYDVTYATNIDTHKSRKMLLRHKAFLSVGHDEYWSLKMRNNIERARNKGVSLGFFGANIGYWQMRFERSPLTGKRFRTLVSYRGAAREKDPLALDGDPDNDHLITTRWRDELLNRKPRPEEALIGVMYHGNPVDSDIVISNAAHWVYTGTGARDGDLLKGLLGYETDASFGYAPPGTEVLAHSPDPWGFSDMTIYEWEPSGATVFATGSIQWSWGLDSSDISPSRVSPVAQQMTRNVLARFVGDDIDGPNSDQDKDGITDADELQTYGTDPRNADSDSDGINDGEELAFWGSRWNEDSDSDDIINLLDPDSDNDSFSDGVEIAQEVDPADANSYPSMMIYEDAENGDTAGWGVYTQGSGTASIKNVYDEDSEDLVIELTGSGTKTGYNLYNENRFRWNNTRHSIIEWRMKYAEAFLVYIAVQTRDGFRYIYYTSTDDNDSIDSDEYVHHNLSSSAHDGNWHTFSRDLAADLKAVQPANELESVLGFFIRGSGRVDDITTKVMP